MAILKFKNADGTWNSIAAFKGEDGKDGAVQYKPGFGINISEDNVISSTLDPELDIVVDTQPIAGSTNPVSSGGVHSALANKADKDAIITDTKDLTNGAGFITSDDVPNDLGAFGNEAGYIKAESDPIFTNSPAAGILASHINNWNLTSELRICPVYYNSVIDLSSSATITNTQILNRVKEYINKYGAGSILIQLITNARSQIYNYINTRYSGTNTAGEQLHYYSSVMDASGYGEIKSARLVIVVERGTGNYKRIELSSYGYQAAPKSNVLTKDNSTAYNPTSDYHPATKKYVDDTLTDGLSGAGFIDAELDPIFSNSPSATITTDDIANWNTVQNKLNKSELPDSVLDIIKNNGYITGDDVSGIVTDAGFITADDIPESLVKEGVGADSIILTSNNTDNVANNTIQARGNYSVASGYKVFATGEASHAEGYNLGRLVVPSGASNGSWIELYGSTGLRVGSRLYYTYTDTIYTVTEIQSRDGYKEVYTSPVCPKPTFGEWYYVNAMSVAAHTEGLNSQASGQGSHAEGTYCFAKGNGAHAEGQSTDAIGSGAHAGGSHATANADFSFAHGDHVTNNVSAATLVGKYGELDATLDADVTFAVANGTDKNNFNIGLKLVGGKGNAKLYVENTLIGADPSTYTGFDPTTTQVLKHINGVFTWVDA